MKKINNVIMCILIITILSACKASTLSANKIANILPQEITTEMEVKKVKIERRQTNDKEDLVYAIIDMANDNVHRTSYYLLTINYYDKGGWILDKWEKYQDSTAYPLTPPTEDMAREILLVNYNDFNIHFRSSDIADFKNGNSSFVFDVDKNKKYLEVAGDLTVNMSFSQYDERWIGYQSDIISNLVEEWKIDGEYTAKWLSTINGRYEKDDEYAELLLEKSALHEVSVKGTIVASEWQKVREKKRPNILFDSLYDWVDKHKINNVYELKFDYGDKNSDFFFKDGKKHMYIELLKTKDIYRESLYNEDVNYYRIFFSEEKACLMPAGFYWSESVKCSELTKTK